MLCLCLSLPDGSPPRAHSPEHPLLTGLLYSGADMLRRKLVGNDTVDRPSRTLARNKILLSRQEKRALRSLKLVEKVESIGLDNIITHQHHVGISPLAMSGRNRTASPMTQLTSLKAIPRTDDPYAVDRKTMRAVLNKGLSHDSLHSELSTDGSTTSSVTNHDDSDDNTSRKPAAAHSTTPLTEPVATPSKAAKEPSRTAPSESRVKHMQRQKSRRNLMNGAGGQRPDLGTVAGARSDTNARNRQVSNKMATNELSDDDSSSIASVAPTSHPSLTQSFVGSISSLFFGRKGGLL